MKVSMIKYLNNILREFPKTLETLALSPADDHLFKVIPYIETKLLPKEQVIVPS